jgi:hypothetical protein
MQYINLICLHLIYVITTFTLLDDIGVIQWPHSSLQKRMICYNTLMKFPVTNNETWMTTTFQILKKAEYFNNSGRKDDFWCTDKSFILLLFCKTNFFRGIPFLSVPFRTSELALPRNSECLGMSAFFRGITETIPSLFLGIFLERNSVPNPRQDLWLRQTHLRLGLPHLWLGRTDLWVGRSELWFGGPLLTLGQPHLWLGQLDLWLGRPHLLLGQSYLWLG